MICKQIVTIFISSLWEKGADFFSFLEFNQWKGGFREFDMVGQKYIPAFFSKALFILFALFAANFAVASEISPFYFSYIEKTDDAKQEAEWQKLIKYKLWGTGFQGQYGVAFYNNDIYMDDSVGYTGSAKGNFSLRNTDHTIGGPLAFGGEYDGRQDNGKDTILTGPSHFGGAIRISSNAAGQVVWHGTVCSDVNTYEYTSDAFSKGHATVDCNSSSLPTIDKDLDIPLFDVNYNFDTTIAGDWLFNKKTPGTDGVIIDIPAGSNDFYDIFVDGYMDIKDVSGKTLYFNNPYNRYVRIFINKALKTEASEHNIVMMDQNGVVSNANYAGNLLIYSKESIDFPACECVYQGTYISGGSISFMQHYRFAGQLLAKQVHIDADFRAGDFRYVPFRPPVIKLDVTSKAYEDNEVEGDTVKLTLSKNPPTRVTFNYCFSLQDANSCNGYKDDENCIKANVNDVLPSTLNSIPLCGRDTAQAEFEQNSTKLKNPIIFHAFDDPYEEDDEVVYIKIFNLTAAITPTGDRDADATYSMKYIIVDNDKKPVSADTTVSSKVNESLTITSFPAYGPDGVTPMKTYNVVIKSVPAAGTLTYNGNTVAVGDTIKALPGSADPKIGVIAGLVFTPVKDAYGTPYASIGFDLCKVDAPDICDRGKKMKINVVNVEFTIRENAPIDTLVGMLDDMRIPGTLSCSIISGNAGTTFRFDTTSILLNSALDFETQPSYAFFVKCSNGTDDDSTVVSIIVIDENESPAIHDTIFHVLENQPIGTVVDRLPVLDEDKNLDFLNNKLKIIGGDSKKYDIDDSTGVITTKVVLDYEADKFDTLYVQVKDSDGNKDTARVIIIIDNEVETSKIIVTRAETKDTVWEFPKDTLYINRTEINLSWTADGIPQPDTLVTDLHEGYNTVTLTYYDKTKDHGTVATIVIFVCTRTPEVKVSVEVAPVVADNIYTIVEQVPASDTSYYVNKTENTLLVEIREPILDATYTDSTCNYAEQKLSINAKLDTLSVAESVYRKMGEIVNANLMLDLNPSTPATKVNANDSLILVTYKTTVAGEKVTVSYYTDSKGDVVKNAAGTEVMTVSFESKDNKGNKITVSYQADAITGTLIEQWNGGSYIVTYPYTDKAGKTIDISYFVSPKGKVMKNEEGNVGFEVTYEYTNKQFGNTSRRSAFVVLDTIVPVVVIESPEDESKVHTNFVEVIWTVNDVKQDTLNMQGLVKGSNAIVRIYRDKAGNEASASVVVVLKNAKDLDINVEKPVAVMSKDRVKDYYSDAKAPSKNQTFAVSIFNNAKDAEEEVLIGGNMKTRDGSGKEPYPGKDDHLGPTVTIDVKMPVASNVGGLATFDDIVSADGLVSVYGVDAEGGKKLAPSQYVAEYCTEEFQESFKGDLSRLNLYNTTVSVHIWIFTNLGSFVDDYSFSVDLNDPDYVNKGGMLSMAFEWKPDAHGDLHTKTGRIVGTGAYLYKTEVTMKTSLRCTLPPISEDMPEANMKGAKRKVSEDKLRSFGYKRPPMKKK